MAISFFEYSTMNYLYHLQNPVSKIAIHGYHKQNLAAIINLIGVRNPSIFWHNFAKEGEDAGLRGLR